MCIQNSTAVVINQAIGQPDPDYTGKATTALVLAICGLICCGEGLIPLLCLIPALILAIFVSKYVLYRLRVATATKYVYIIITHM